MAGSGWASTNERIASSRAAALLDGLFAHPAGHCNNTDIAHELIVLYRATIEFSRSLLGESEPHCFRESLFGRTVLCPRVFGQSAESIRQIDERETVGPQVDREFVPCQRH